MNLYNDINFDYIRIWNKMVGNDFHGRMYLELTLEMASISLFLITLLLYNA
jgi:hypothetical protein